MSTLHRLPDATGNYYAVQSGRHWQVHSLREGLVLDEIDSLGDAQGHVLQFEYEDAERAAEEEREIAEAAAFDSALDALAAQPSAELRTLFTAINRAA